MIMARHMKKPRKDWVVIIRKVQNYLSDAREAIAGAGANNSGVANISYGHALRICESNGLKDYAALIKKEMGCPEDADDRYLHRMELFSAKCRPLINPDTLVDDEEEKERDDESPLSETDADGELHESRRRNKHLDDS
ncbi:MAG: hypothetical protein ABIG30_01400 [Candidatus Aenigmatarchaeota archaeon]